MSARTDPTRREQRTRGRRQANARNIAHGCRAEYEATKNPLQVWLAIHACLSNGLPLPKWTEPYLDEAATNLSKLWLNGSGTTPQGKAISTAVAKALRLQGGPGFNPFPQWHDAKHDTTVASEVYIHHLKQRTDHRAGKREEKPSRKEAYCDVATSHRCYTCYGLPDLGLGPTRRRTITWKTVEKIWYKNRSDYAADMALVNSSKRRFQP